MDLNKWLSIFMLYLRRFYCNDDMAFIYNEILKEFGIACSNAYVLYKGNDKKYFASDFEKCISNFWAYGPCESWTKIEIYVHDAILWFARRSAFGRVSTAHYCDLTCIRDSKSHDSTFDVILDSKCLSARNSVIKKITQYEKDLMRKLYCFELLEFQEKLPEPTHKLKFKKLSEKATAPARATDGSVDYDLYSTEDSTIFLHGCKIVATDIILVPPPGVYPRITPRSSLALKNTNVRAGVLDVNYRGHVKVVIMITVQILT